MRLDDRTAALINIQCLPWATIIQTIYPDMYRVDSLETCLHLGGVEAVNDCHLSLFLFRRTRMEISSLSYPSWSSWMRKSS